MESSLRDPSNYMAENGSILKNDQNTYYSCFSFKTDIALPKMGVLFWLWKIKKMEKGWVVLIVKKNPP